MSAFSSQFPSRAIVGLVLAGACGLPWVCLAGPATPPHPEPSPHPLVTAAERLYERKMPEACEGATKMGLGSPDAADSDRVRLHLLIAMLRLDAEDEAGARKAIGEALKLDRDARMPSMASPKARELLEDARAILPPAKPAPPIKRPKSRASAGFVLFPGKEPPPPAPPPPREPPSKPLIRAMDAFYQNMQLDAAEEMLNLAQQAQPLAKEEQTQVALRWGILRMEAGEETAASRFF